MVALNKKITMVQMQFALNNRDLVPGLLPDLGSEKQDLAAKREKRANGHQFLEPTPEISLRKLGRDLDKDGFVLVDAFTQQRMRRGGLFHVVRYVFGREDKTSDWIRENRTQLLFGLRVMVAPTTWQVSGFDNPFFLDGEEVEGQRCLTFNVNGRNPNRAPRYLLRAIDQRVDLHSVQEAEAANATA